MPWWKLFWSILWNNSKQICYPLNSIEILCFYNNSCYIIKTKLRTSREDFCWKLKISAQFPAKVHALNQNKVRMLTQFDELYKTRILRNFCRLNILWKIGRAYAEAPINQTVFAKWRSFRLVLSQLCVLPFSLWEKIKSSPHYPVLIFTKIMNSV
jgi:hypothetical protein